MVIEEIPQANTVEDEGYDDEIVTKEIILNVEADVQDTLEVEPMLPTLSPSPVIQSPLFEWIPIQTVFSMGPHEYAILETDYQLHAIFRANQEIAEIGWAQEHKSTRWRKSSCLPSHVSPLGVHSF